MNPHQSPHKQKHSLLLFSNLKKRIHTCDRCPRLRRYCKEIAIKKRRAFQEDSYWGKPVCGWGDLSAKLIIIGLAPAAHGANRTGRMFTGDRSGDWLYRALFETKFANQPISSHKEDGLILNKAYITAIIRCAPPKNTPQAKERKNCEPFLREELNLLKSKKIILALGQLAYHQTWKILNPKMKKPRFRHGLSINISEALKLFVSYHPSQQNTFTKKLTWSAFLNIFKNIQKHI